MVAVVTHRSLPVEGILPHRRSQIRDAVDVAELIVDEHAFAGGNAQFAEALQISARIGFQNFGVSRIDNHVEVPKQRQPFPQLVAVKQIEFV